MVSSANVPISIVQTFWRTLLDKLKIDSVKMFRTMGRSADQLLMLTVIESYIWPFLVAVVGTFWNFLFSWTPMSLIGFDDENSVVNQAHAWAMESFWLSWTLYLTPLILILMMQDLLFERVPRWNDVHMQPRKESIKVKLARIFGSIIVAGHNNVVAWEGRPDELTEFTPGQFRAEIEEDNLIVAGVNVDSNHFGNPITDHEKSSRCTRAFADRVNTLRAMRVSNEPGWLEAYSREYIQLHKEVADYFDRMSKELRKQTRIVKELADSDDWMLSSINSIFIFFI